MHSDVANPPLHTPAVTYAGPCKRASLRHLLFLRCSVL